MFWFLVVIISVLQLQTSAEFISSSDLAQYDEILKSKVSADFRKLWRSKLNSIVFLKQLELAEIENINNFAETPENYQTAERQRVYNPRKFYRNRQGKFVQVYKGWKIKERAEKRTGTGGGSNNVCKLSLMIF